MDEYNEEEQRTIENNSGLQQLIWQQISLVTLLFFQIGVLTICALVVKRNKDQEQIYYVAVIYLIISTFKVFLFILQIYTLRQENIETYHINQKRINHYKALDQNMILYWFYPFHYIILYLTIAQILMRIKLDLTYKVIPCASEDGQCREKVQAEFHGYFTDSLNAFLLAYIITISLYFLYLFLIGTCNQIKPTHVFEQSYIQLKQNKDNQSQSLHYSLFIQLEKYPCIY